MIALHMLNVIVKKKFEQSETIKMTKDVSYFLGDRNAQ